MKIQMRNMPSLNAPFKAVALGLLFLHSLAYSRSAETRDLPSFSAISLGISANVVVKQGSPQSVRLEGDAKDLERIDTRVRDDELVIEMFKGGGGNNNLGRVTIYITVPEVDKLAVGGSGEIRSDGPIKTDNLKLKITGSGDVELEAEADEMESKISGSGQIVLSGKAGSNRITISGSGQLKAEALRTKECKIKISGSGNCRVEVAERLEVDVSGSGNVYYRGDPERVYSNIAGSGNLRRLD